MSKNTFLVASIAAALTISAAITVAQLLSNTAKPVTATRTVEFYDGGASAPWLQMTEILAVRDDGSNVKARRITHPDTGGALYIRKLYDMSRKTLMVINPLAESITTYPLGDTLETNRIKPASACVGSPAGEMLGYPVTLESKDIDAQGALTRLRTWRSPVLDCLPMKEENRLIKHGVETLTVTTVTNVRQGQPEAWLFEIPSTYAEKKPTEMFAEQARRYPQRYKGAPNASTLDAVYDAAQTRK